MRRDYFTCVFLACIAASLFFVWLLPLYFTYGLIVPREFGSVETVAGFAFAAAVLIVIPLFAAWSKKKWIAMGLAFYGIVPYLPIWFLPKITERISEGKASVISSMSGFLLKSIYGMVNAPFAPLSKYLGDDAASALSLWILPVSVCTYVMFQLVRFYRDAYVAEQLDPQSVVDTTAKENKRQQPDGSSGHRMREAKAPEVLGTVISDLLNGLSCNFLEIYEGMGCYLSHDIDDPGGACRFARDPCHGILSQYFVKDGIGDLVADLVRMSFGN